MRNQGVFCLLMGSVLIASAGLTQEKAVSFEEALHLFESGQTQVAAETFRALAETDSQNPDVLAYAGIAVGSLAGQAQQDYMAAGRLAMESLGYLDRAVNLDARHVKARLYRGLMGVNVPAFMGRLDQGITDLLTVLGLHKTDPDKVPDEDLITAHRLLIRGYEKKQNPDEAMAVIKRLMQLYPDHPALNDLKDRLAQYKAEGHEAETAELNAQIESFHKEEGNVDEDMRKAQALIEQGEKEKALAILKEAAESAPGHEALYPLILQLLSDIVETGYDASIREDTDTRSKQAFDIMNWSEKAVLAFPDNPRFRLIRGAMGVNMPFFVGKLDQGIEDLRQVVTSDVPDSLKAEALYLLGLGHTRKAMFYWNEVATRFDHESAYRDVLAAMHPDVEKADEENLNKPVLLVDFISAYRDQLAPQTAVWIENEQGEHIKTLYVSGFSGHAKDVQVVLPQWANHTGFKGVDGVTGASIAAGEHVMTWDLTDLEGRRVPEGIYTVFVEVSHWPSMKYQVVSSAIKIGGKRTSAVKKEGDFLPFLELTYLPK